MKATKTLGWLVMAAVLFFTGCSSDDNTTEEPMPPLGTQTGNIVDLSKLTDDYVAQDSDVLTGKLSGYHKISIAPGATVTLSGVTIPGRVAEDDKTPWAGITCLGNATIVLADGTENYVMGNHGDYPGIQAGPTAFLKSDYSTLTIRGKGSLTAVSGRDSQYNSGFAAGIGSGQGLIVGNIRIEDGNITAQGDYGGAGIGAGYAARDRSSCGDITIVGGNITATGGDGAAGIGTGMDFGCVTSCDNITIIAPATGIAMGGDGSPKDIGAGVNGICGDVNVAAGTISYIGDDVVPCTFNITFKKGGSIAAVWTNEITMTGSAEVKLTNNGKAIASGTSITADMATLKLGTLTFTANCKNYAGGSSAGSFSCTLNNVRIVKNGANTFDVEMQWLQ